MTALIVGEGKTTFNQVIATMEKSSVFETCRDRWRDLALKLDTSSATLSQIERKMKLDESYGTSIIILDLLTEWRARVSTNAKLEIFTEALTKIGLDDISTILTNEFSTQHGTNSDSVDPALAKREDNTTLGKENGKRINECLQYYIIDLIQITDLSDSLVEAMTAKGVLERKDLDNINRSRLIEDKVKRFYQIILEKISKEPEVYEIILTVFMEDNSNRERGVTNILKRCV